MTLLEGKCRTTAMGILPHKEIEPALKLALDVDIPFWPQLPRESFYEDMYVQISEHFPGMTVDVEKQKIAFNLEKFYEELPIYAEKSADPQFFRLTDEYSLVFKQFLELDLSKYYAIRGQTIGPVSFGMKIFDTERKPIIYNSDVREFLFDFIAQKVNEQTRQLREKNPNAFVWIDEPGLEIVFGSFSGYSSEAAKADLRRFFEQVEGVAGVHLCGNPDWSFLLSGVPLDILSLDVFSNGSIFSKYTGEIADFLHRGGIISWGIVPTLTGEISPLTAKLLVTRLEEIWDYLAAKGISKELIIDRAWLAPARCCLVNADGEKTVDKAFVVLKEVSTILKEKYGIAF